MFGTDRRSNARPHPRRERGIVDEHRIVRADRYGQIGGRAIGLGGVFGDRMQVIDRLLAHLRSKVRRVPCISTWSGTMLNRVPPRITPKVSTAGRMPMSSLRLTIVRAAR